MISSNEADRAATLLRVVAGRAGPLTPESADWGEWTWFARMERVAPLLYQLVDTVASDLSDEDRQEVRQLKGSAMLRCVQLEHHLIVAATLLAEHGIRCVVLKGGATSHLDYPDPSWREYADVDLLIDPADRARATELLTRQGWSQGYALPRGHEPYTHAVTFVQDRMELDLHQRIGHRAIGLLVPTGELLDRALPFEVAGSELLALDDVDRLIHSALHSAVARGSNRRLSSIADVLLSTERRPSSAHEVIARSEAWQVRPLVEQSVRDAYAAAHLELHCDWAAAMRSPIHRRDRLVDRAYLSRFRRPVVEELAYLRLLPGWQHRWRYLRGYLATDPDYARQHGRSGVRAQVRYVLSKLRSGLP
jgi:Uncharacterised nucleotidyltransferase